MKKRLFSILIFAFAMLSCTAYASNNVSSIDIDVLLNGDGSAEITQLWKGSFDEGTENYIVINNLDGMTVEDLSVSDDDGEYEVLPDWDIDASFEEKAEKCGIRTTDEGYELCFGISGYGDRNYRIKYKIDGLAGGYDDYDGFNFMFINRGMNTFPTDASVTVRLADGTALDAENAGVWGFGYDGQAVFENETVKAYTTSPLEDDNSVIVMLRLNKGLIEPARFVGGSFDSVQNRAFEDSDYGMDSEDAMINKIIAAVIILALIAAVIGCVKAVIRRKEIRNFYNSAEYFSDIPNGGDMRLSYYLAKNFNMIHDESTIIGAALLEMIRQHCIEPETTEKAGFMGRVKENVELRLISEPEDGFLNGLYAILKAAAGGDGVLQKGEMADYCGEHPDELRNIIKGAEASGRDAMSRLGGFSNGAGNSLKDLTNPGKQQLAEAMGLKKYLLDFSLIKERGVSETAVWREYMVYAALFGIADKVMEQFRKIYPDMTAEFDAYDRDMVIVYAYYSSMYRAMTNAEQMRTSGAGGASSLGGGGGFSGGGSGGGSR